jgi:hypothetical protein
MNENLDNLFSKLLELWLYDISIMSQSWMYWLVIPAISYSVFMILKWFVLTSPIWIPISIIFSSFNSIKKSK